VTGRIYDIRTSSLTGCLAITTAASRCLPSATINMVEPHPQLDRLIVRRVPQAGSHQFGMLANAGGIRLSRPDPKLNHCWAVSGSTITNIVQGAIGTGSITWRHTRRLRGCRRHSSSAVCARTRLGALGLRCGGPPVWLPPSAYMPPPPPPSPPLSRGYSMLLS
jgi:hypothetical protein